MVRFGFAVRIPLLVFSVLPAATDARISSSTGTGTALSSIKNSAPVRRLQQQDTSTPDNLTEEQQQEEEEPAETVKEYQTYECPESFDSAAVIIPPESLLSQDDAKLIHARISLTPSEPDRLCTLVRVTAVASSPDGALDDLDNAASSDKLALAPVGRSYNGRSWERVAGPYTSLSYDCNVSSSGTATRSIHNTCQVTLPRLEFPDRQRYVLLTYEHDLSSRNVVARFLSQTTFGVTRSELDEFPSATTKADTDTNAEAQDLETSFAKWIQHQMNDIPATSHREFFRRRLNSRFDVAKSIGMPNHPCRRYSQWRNFAFIELDYGRTVAIKPVDRGGGGGGDDDDAFALYVDGNFRTLVRDDVGVDSIKALLGATSNVASSTGGDKDTFVDTSASNGAGGTATTTMMVQSGYDGTAEAAADADGYHYKVCEIPEAYVGGDLYLEASKGSAGCTKLEGGNMPLVLDETVYVDTATMVLDLPSLDSASIKADGNVDGQWMLQTDLTQEMCDEITIDHLAINHPIFGRLPGGGDGMDAYVIHDPRLSLLNNTLEQPLEDGGGSLVQSGGTHNGASMLCSNVPRTFLNEDTCRLSQAPTTCTSQDMGGPSIMLTLDEETVARLSGYSKRYVYLMAGLRVEKGDTLPPCTPGVKSRWAKVQKPHGELCGGSDDLHLDTQSAIGLLLDESKDLNSAVKDIPFPEESKFRCASSDEDKIGFEVLNRDGLSCWKHVHQDHMSVYDFEYWTGPMHAGNVAKESRGEPNPIKSPFDLYGYANLTFPWHHPMNRWNEFKNGFEFIGRLGDTIDFRDLPELLRGQAVADGFGVATDDAATSNSIMVCGSPGEVSNDPTISGASFIPATGDKVDVDLMSDRDFFQHRATAWTTIALTAPDQLRQRMAWALAQLLVVSPIAMENRRNTENFLTYYDIFTRHAFGNYRDILLEVSYSPIMADFLTFLDSRSASLIWEKEKKRIYADENYAREIMQLFTLGLVRLNEDGTPVLDETGGTIATYNNENIMSLSRAWTGFERRKKRSNVENFVPGPNSNRIDPLMINPEWRDVFPKTDLSGGFLGDKYPLCEDLPDKMFLRKGARYRLLGSSRVPEYQSKAKPILVGVDPKNLKLKPSSSSLFRELCQSSGTSPTGPCNYANEVVLSNSIECAGNECSIDTVQVVEVTKNIFYEFIRPPCVEASFFQGGRVIRHWNGEANICANPALPIAAEACCPIDGGGEAKRKCLYTGEEMTFRGALQRCSEAGMRVCDFKSVPELSCDECCIESSFHWVNIPAVTSGISLPRRGRDECTVQVKIRADGYVAIVHDIGGLRYDDKVLPPLRVDNKNFFRVYWGEDGYPLANSNNCGGGACMSVGEDCICKVVVSDEAVFSSMPRKEDAVSNIFVGALDPLAYGSGSYTEAKHGSNIVAYHSTSEDSTFSRRTIFELTDDFSGRQVFLKNSLSTVRIPGTAYNFRNPPHFLSLFDPEVRDAAVETEAVIDSVFRHDNVAPFLATRFIQRFGLSNPSPRLVKSVASAFRRGMYSFESSDGSETIEYGSGEYGSMAAMLPAILLDAEFRAVVLDADPSSGSLHEPLLSVVAFLRSMEFQPQPGNELVKLLSMESRIGQMAHEPLTVFSFFLPHYVPGSGPIHSASLVAPEAQLLAMSPVVSALNGLFSLTKYGLLSCMHGFGVKPKDGCSRLKEGDFSRSSGKVSYEPARNSDTAAIIEELSTLLTAGRLSDTNKEEIIAQYKAREKEEGKEAALRLALQLMIATPEYRTSGVTRKAEDEARPQAASQPTCKAYKAVVFLMLQGGADSYNMLVPHSGCKDKDMYEEYKQARQHLALDKDAILQIESNSEKQPCTKFGLHPQLPTLQGLYNDDSALFMANIGTPMEIYDNRLYGHEQMQTVCKQMDVGRNTTGTGILGRFVDVLQASGVTTGAVSINYVSETLQGKAKSSSNMVVSEKNIEQFAPKPSTQSFIPAIENINGASSWRSSVFAETWSSVLRESIEQNTVAFRALESSEVQVEFPKSSIGKQLQTVARLISSRKCRGVERDVFYVSQGGYDHHYNVNRGLKRNFIELDEALAAFVAELKEQDHYDNVVVVSSSEFGRTIIPDSRGGSDHGWGGNNFMFGGQVKGGQIVGQYPSDISEESELNLGRGRMLPTTSFDAIWSGIARWFGIEQDAALDEALPFRKYLKDEEFTDADLFISSDVDDGTECSEEELASICGIDEGQNGQNVRRSAAVELATGIDRSERGQYTIGFVVVAVAVVGLGFALFGLRK